MEDLGALVREVEHVGAGSVRAVGFWDKPMEAIEDAALLVLGTVDPPTRLAVLCVIDDDSPLERLAYNPRVSVFRTSMYRSLASRNEHILPYIFHRPLLAMDPLPKGDAPRVAFCGFYMSHPLRATCINALIDDARIDDTFVLRGCFLGYEPGYPRDPRVQEDYRVNMAASEFNVCVRGRGNFSMRFYEALSAGRIPVLLDTDMPLPCADEVPWDEVCVISKSPKSMADDVVRFWETHDIPAAQRRCKEVFDRCFNFDSVARTIAGATSLVKQGTTSLVKQGATSLVGDAIFSG